MSSICYDNPDISPAVTSYMQGYVWNINQQMFKTRQAIEHNTGIMLQS